MSQIGILTSNNGDDKMLCVATLWNGLKKVLTTGHEVIIINERGWRGAM